MLFHSVSVIASMVGRCDCIHWEESGQVCWNTLQSRRLTECQAKRQMTGIGSIWFEIRLKFCPMVST